PAAHILPGGSSSANLNRVLTLKGVGIGAVIVIRDRADGGLEDEEIHRLGPIAPSKAVVVGWTRHPALHQASGERNRSGPIVIAGVAGSGCSPRARGHQDEERGLQQHTPVISGTVPQSPARFAGRGGTRPPCRRTCRSARTRSRRRSRCSTRRSWARPNRRSRCPRWTR